MPKAKYTDIKSDKKDDGSSTDTEVAVPLMDEERGENWKNEFDEVELRSSRRKARGLRRVWNGFQPYRWMVDTSLLLVILVLLLRRQDNTFASLGRPKQDIGGDTTGFFPEFSKEVKTFYQNKDYIPDDPKEFFRYNAQKNWLDLVPTGLGFIKVDEPEKYTGLPTPLPEYTNGTVFTTSMTHQLHCLYSIVDNYFRLKLDYNINDEDWHVRHCFDYLRQSIMCSADVSVEGAETTFPEGERGGSDGWDAKHVCRRYSEVFDYLEARSAVDSKWI